MISSFRINSKYLFLTYPHCDEEKSYMVKELIDIVRHQKHCVDKYYAVRETHEDGTFHIHVYLKLEARCDVRNPKYFDIPKSKEAFEVWHGNYQHCRNPIDVLNYLGKEDPEPMTNISVEERLQPSMKKEPKRLTVGKKILAGEKLDDLVGEDPSLVFGYARLKNDINLFMLDRQKPTTTEDVRGIWIYGEPGTGKSHSARHDYGDSPFIKAQSKWWDGYNGELTVILEDLDSPALGHLLKIWADRWACTGEVKGGTVPLLHTRFVVTSNYTPEVLWGGEFGGKSAVRDEAMVFAIRRRFKFIHKVVPKCGLEGSRDE